MSRIKERFSDLLTQLIAAVGLMAGVNIFLYFYG